MMPRGPDAFLARLALMANAERSLDIQYYIWHNDTTGRLLLVAMLRAAERGVRVRLLIDDVGSAPKDKTLLMLDSHPNIEVRVFNPAANRSARRVWVFSDFSRVNQRMHNKLITADSQVAIVGGRNIGDEYFETGAELNYADVDALVIGAAVAKASDCFDRYWNSPTAYGIKELAKEEPTAAERARALAALQEFERGQRGQAFDQAMRESPLAEEIRAGAVVFSAARITVKADDPAKVEHPGQDPSKNLMPQLAPQFAAAQERVFLVSPYFVPGKRGLEFLRQLRARGVKVAVLTNGLASTDMLPVFGKYKKYRRPLLEAGVEIYEVNPTRGHESPAGLQQAANRTPPGGTPPRAALHGKLLVFDCREFFVGSMNLDPRSVHINTEIGLVVDAPDVAATLCGGLDMLRSQGTYRLELQKTKDGRTRLEWVGRDAGQAVRLTSEPHATSWQRVKAWFYGILPIEKHM